MSEIRDSVIQQIAYYVENRFFAESWVSEDAVAEKILSIHELAIVDREAELPQVPDSPVYSDKPYTDIERLAFRVGALTFKGNMLKAGWVKEVKE